MSDQTNVYKLKEILERSDEELTSNWSRLASLIKNYEKMAWRDAQKLASQLIKDGKAGKYVADVRKKISSKKSKGKTGKKSNTKKEKQAKVIPINTRRDRFSMNYKRLLKIAPDLIERLENGEQVRGKSIKTGYMDFNLELIRKDKTGYYLAISHYKKYNGDMIADPDMQILLDVEFETVQALAFQNEYYYREVYDDIYERKAVYMEEKKAQNSFLQDWLINLFNQGHEIQWLHDKAEPEKSKDVGQREMPPSNSSDSFKVNYGKLLKLVPGLDRKLKKHGLNLQGRSEKEGLLYDFILKVTDEYDSAYNLLLVESGYIDGELEEYTAMTVRINLKTKEIKAVLTFLPDGEKQKVYENVHTLEGESETEKEQQNAYLSKWLDELIEKGHKIDQISDTRIDLLEAFRKANKTKTEKEKKDLPDQNISRLEKARHNQVLKTNYQKLMRLVPGLFDLEINNTVRLTTKDNEVLYLTPLPMKGNFAHVYEFSEPESNDLWTIHLQKTVGKVLGKFQNPTKKNTSENPDEKHNKLLGSWLSQKIKQGYEFPQDRIERLLKKYPIVLEFTEGAFDNYVGFHSLEKLRTRFKGYGFTDSPTETYIKNKVWFRGYSSEVNIDLSEKEGDYNPGEQNLLDWLNENEPNFDWSKFSRPRAKKKEKTAPKKSRKELQKEVENEIPDFQPGKVKLMPAHIKRGIKQKHIDWINKHKQGMTITPINRMVNNTEDFFSDMNKKAKKPGFRISRTGKLYYETRSNRSDITGKNL